MAPAAMDAALRDPAGPTRRALEAQLTAVEGEVRGAAEGVLERLVQEDRYGVLNAALLRSVEARAAAAVARVEERAAAAWQLGGRRMWAVVLLAVFAGGTGAALVSRL